MNIYHRQNIARYISSIIIGIVIFCACSNSSIKHRSSVSAHISAIETLKTSLVRITTKYPGEIGIALITGEGDTIVVNNEAKYPLMSVFKLHQAIALCDLFERRSASLDSVVDIPSSSLNPNTWSPMLKNHSQRPIHISVRELLSYTLMQSDNNASNYMFKSIQSVDAVDSLIATLIPRESFRLTFTEADMSDNHARCYDNYSSPLGAAMLINRLFTDTTLCHDNRDFICTKLQECNTGTDRIVAPLSDKRGVVVAHKTGSGFRDTNGILSAHNDVAFITLPDCRHYTLVVFVKDFHGTESEAAQAIAEISGITYTTISTN